MHTGKPNGLSVVAAMLLLWILLGVSACGVIPKNYPKGKPFVFKTTIKVNGNYQEEERQALQDRLYGQLDDSLTVRSVSKLFVKEIRLY